MGFVLDAYAARSCPLKTVYRFTPGLEPPVDRLPDPPFFHDADAIEAAVFARLLASDDETVDLRDLAAPDSATAERATIAAMRAGAPIILAPV
ncbi:MAG: nuclease, partial [Propioniciclava sp.]